MRRSGERGFSLTELLITLTILSLVVGAIMTVFYRSQALSNRMTKLVDKRQNARGALQILERDIRMAGSGWAGAGMLNASISGVAKTLRGISVGYSSAAGDDSIVVIGCWSTLTTIK